MSDNLKKSLHNYEGLDITFFVEDGQARIEFESNGQKYDLSDPDDVVVVVNGDPASVESEDVHHATAHIGEWQRFSGDRVNLMIRVGEFFEGWEVET